LEKVSKNICYPDESMGIVCNNIVIGTFHLIGKNNMYTQIGFGIHESFWNKGIGTIVVKKIFDYINDSSWKVKTKIICADVNKDNIYAKKVLQKNGFYLYQKNIELNRDRFIYNL
jgi:RimJ/RimL family protein N-acetyltransferase